MQLPDQYGVDQQAIERRRQMAQALMQQSQQPLPNGQMVGRVFVGTNPLQHLAQGLRGYSASKQLESADADQKALAGRQQARNQQDMQGVIAALRGTPSFQTPANEMGDETVMQNAVPGDPARAGQIAMGSQNPQLQQLGMGMLKEQFTPKKPVVVGRSLVDPATGKVIGTDATWQAEQDTARQAKAAEIQARLEDAKISRQERADLQRELAQMRADAQREMRMLAGSMRQPQAPVAVLGDDGKPVYVSAAEAVGRKPASKTGENKLPTSALKMQQEELDAIGTASTIGADLDAVIKQIDDKKLDLGIVNNAVGAARNALGVSSENSRNLATFKATLEKMRNDSLRLNKGVQTEGDAVRAWNEILTNINDPKLVKQRLGEVKAINQRAAGLRRMNVDQIRTNFGVEPMDVAPYQNQPAAIGGGTPAFDPAAIDAELARRRGKK